MARLKVNILPAPSVTLAAQIATINANPALTPSAKKKILAPLLFQQKVNTDIPIGINIPINKIREAVTNFAIRPWDFMVCFAGLEADMTTINPVVRFYRNIAAAPGYVEVPDVIGGGGAGGVTASGSPPPTLP